MDKKTLRIIITVLAVIVALVILNPFWVLREGEQAVVTRFGKIVDVQTHAGLKVRVPLVDNITRYSARILSWDGESQRIPTKENQFIFVDPTSRWIISDPALFYETVNTVETAQLRLDDILDSTIRTVISENSLNEAVRNSNRINTMQVVEQVSSVENVEDAERLRSLTLTDSRQETISIGREGLSRIMLENASSYTGQYGITLIDVIIRQIRYSDDLTESVYQRMIKERNQIAEAYRSYGRGQKAEWEGKTQSEQMSILSSAYAESERIKGVADAQATRVYAQAYSEDPQFFELWRSLESYRKTVGGMNKILTTDLPYFDVMYGK